MIQLPRVYPNQYVKIFVILSSFTEQCLLFTELHVHVCFYIGNNQDQDEHQLMLNRLEWELEQRKQYVACPVLIPFQFFCS